MKAWQASSVPKAPRHTRSDLVVAGWREWVSLPDVGVPWIKAKLDTGARTSSIHAYDIDRFDRDGLPWVRFEIHPWQRSQRGSIAAELPVTDERVVRSSTGHEESRVVVAATIVLCSREVEAELTLTNRDEMGFRMLVGREALRGVALVDSERSYLGGKPPRGTRKRYLQAPTTDGEGSA